MRPIDKEKQSAFQHLLNKHDSHIESLTGEEKNKYIHSLEKAAEIKALRTIVIPQGFQKFSFEDFDGQVGNNAFLPQSVAAKAKESLCKLCWDKSLEEVSEMTSKERIKNSVFSRRINDGVNIIIHGDSSVNLDEETGLSYSPIGRTFVAAILTREAIALKSQYNHRMLTYDWVEFPTLREAVSNDDNEKMAEYQTADWLVIDNITEAPLRASQAAKDYLQAKLDPFFFYRLEYKRPTVLVFKFNIEDHASEIEQSFGNAMNRVAMGSGSFRIKLDRGNHGRR